MASPLTPVDPQRLQHGHGEALLRRDFTDQARLDDQLRWWHNRAVHQAYGVVEGFDVTIAAVRGVPTASVGPGLAYDCHGRELILRESRQVAVPDSTEALRLVVAYDGAARACAPPLGGYCRDDQIPDHQVTLRWVPRSRLTVRDGVPLAGNDADAPVAAPRARPFARPRIGHGASIAGETAWKPWTEVLDEEPMYLGIQVDIDTSAAGFTDTPCYFVEVDGALWTAQFPLILLVPFGHVADANKDRFTYRLLMPWLYLPHYPQPQVGREDVTPPARTGARSRLSELDYETALRGLARATGLAVTWIGVQQHGTGTSPAHLDRNGGRHEFH